MNPTTKVFVALQVNGGFQDWGQVEIRKVPLMLGRWVLESELDSRDFSSLQLQLSKRPISPNQRPSVTGETGGAIAQVDADEPFDSQGDITFGEISDLSDDPVWTQYQALRRAPDEYPQSESSLIVRAWTEKYGQSKYARLLNGA